MDYLDCTIYSLSLLVSWAIFMELAVLFSLAKCKKALKFYSGDK